MEYVKSFGISQHKSQGQDEYVIEIDKENNKMTYAPMQAKLTLLKKRAMDIK